MKCSDDDKVTEDTQFFRGLLLALLLVIATPALAPAPDVGQVLTIDVVAGDREELLSVTTE